MSLQPSKLLAAIAEESTSSRSLLFLWLMSDPEDVREFTNVADQLLAAGERNLAHLVIHRGLAKLPENESLCLYALGLEIQNGDQLAA